MANVVYNQFMDDLANKLIDLETDLFKVRLCMTNTICDAGTGTTATDDSVRRAATLTVLQAVGAGIDMFDGEVSGTTYAVGTDDIITTPTINQATVAGTNRVNWTGDNVEWLAVGDGGSGDGTRNIQGALVYWEPGSGSPGEGDRIPVCFIDFASDIVTDGSDIKIKWDGGASSGNILRMQQA